MPTLSDSLTEVDYQEAFHEILSEAKENNIENHSPSREVNPTVIIFGGQPGAGKSHSISRCELFNQPHFRIDTDMLREYVPGFTEMAKDYHLVDRASEESHEAASTLADMLLDHAISNRFNIILDKTLSSEKSIDLAERLREAGYTVKLQIVATDQFMSDKSVYERYLNAMLNDKPSRMVDTRVREPAYGNLPSVIDKFHERGFTDIKINVRYADHTNEQIYDGPESRKPSVALIEGRERSHQSINIDKHLEEWTNTIERLKEKGADPTRIERAEALFEKHKEILNLRRESSVDPVLTIEQLTSTNLSSNFEDLNIFTYEPRNQVTGLDSEPEPDNSHSPDKPRMR